MKGLISAISSWKSIVTLSIGGLVFASCSNEASDGPANLDEYQTQVYNSAFADAFGTPAADHNWGFGSFAMAEVSKTTSSFDFVNAAATRAVAGSVTPVNATTYATFADVMKNPTAKCYFYVRIDNRIVLEEKNIVMSNPSDKYYPKPVNLGNGVTDCYYSTDNEGLIDTKMLNEIANVRTNGVSIATDDEPIPDALFKQAPTFETISLHIPDADKIALAGSVEKFEQNYKIFWYVAKYQESDHKIHVDGVVVKKEQITINIPEYKKRIIVEDLKGNINANTKVNSSDFDFNDVVFDAITWNRDGKIHLKIIVRAAGGQLPIYVKGKEVHEGIGYMFNTSDPDYEFGKVLIKDEIIGDATVGSNASTFDFNSIPVEIEIGEQKIPAGSNIGVAPEKIAVGLDYKWCKERQSIKEAYSRFVDYVADKSKTNWYKPLVLE